MDHKLIKQLIIVSLILLSPLLLQVPVLADGGLGVESDIGLQPIIIPTFVDLSYVQNFSLESYFALAASLIYVGIAVYWVFLVVKAAVGIVGAGSDSGKVGESYKQVSSVFVSIALLFGFIVVLALVASAFGIGQFYQWPRMFSKCRASGRDNQYYFTVLQEVRGNDPLADTLCFGGYTI